MEIQSVIAIIIASMCFTTALSVLARMQHIDNKLEGLAFFGVALTTALWAIKPFANTYWGAYHWVSGIILSDFALLYVMLITTRKYNKFMIPMTIACNLGILVPIPLGLYTHPNYAVAFSLLCFPLIVLMTIILFRYAYKHKRKLHFFLGIVSALMLGGGFYDTYQAVLDFPNIPAATISCLSFVFIAGFHLMNQGYLVRRGWKDYASDEGEELHKNQYMLLKKTNIESVIVLSQTIEAKDKYTRGHCLRVMDYARAIAKELGISRDKLLMLEFGAVLHDIGKIGIMGRILNKPDKLTRAEFQEIKKHPVIGARIIKNVDFYKPIIPMIRHHHEFYNGGGYPDGIKKIRIPLEARILSIADAYDAMTTSRPYRKALKSGIAQSILRQAAGSQFDPELVELFLDKKLYKSRPRIGQRIKFDF